MWFFCIFMLHHIINSTSLYVYVYIYICTIILEPNAHSFLWSQTWKMHHTFHVLHILPGLVWSRPPFLEELTSRPSARSLHLSTPNSSHWQNVLPLEATDTWPGQPSRFGYAMDRSWWDQGVSTSPLTSWCIIWDAFLSWAHLGTKPAPVSHFFPCLLSPYKHQTENETQYELNE